MFNKDHSFSIDQCGNVDQIGEHAAVLIPFYFLPLIILIGLVAREIASRVITRLHYRLVNIMTHDSEVHSHENTRNKTCVATTVNY